MYGSVTYGLECRVVELRKADCLILECSHLGKSEFDTAPFLESVFENPKGLAAIQLVFFLENDSEQKLRLTTQSVPELEFTTTSTHQRFLIRGVVPLTPQDENLWQSWQDSWMGIHRGTFR
jgi:hypothetical protein